MGRTKERRTIVNIEQFMKKIYEFETAYFPTELSIDGITIRNKVSRQYEDNTIRDKYLLNGEINETVVAWKTGTLVEDLSTGNYKISMDNEKKTIKGYRVNINRQELQKYLEFVDKIWDDHNLSEKKFWDIFQSLVESETKIPDGFGTVYIINLMVLKKSLMIIEAFVTNINFAILTIIDSIDIFVFFETTFFLFFLH